MPNVSKFIMKEGRVVINPEYQALISSAASSAFPSAPPPAYSAECPSAATVAYPSAPPPAEGLTVVSTHADLVEISQLTELVAPPAYEEAVAMVTSDAYRAQINTQAMAPEYVLDGLSRVFLQNEIPMGLVSKLTALREAAFHFKIDSSASMTLPSNLTRASASACMQGFMVRKVSQLSRWQEAEDRMHRLIELLAYIPTGPIIMSLFDYEDRAGARIILERGNQSPEEFIDSSHVTIHTFFTSNQPSGNTPIYRNMLRMMQESNDRRQREDYRTFDYLLSDGAPNHGEEEVKRIKELLQSPQRNAQLNPFTFLGCSNQPSDYEWMSEVDEAAPFVAAVSDFANERLEVMRDQGIVFPYTRGVWLLCNLAAAANPNDLDALDELVPLTKVALDELMGRILTDNEYLAYFDSHPKCIIFKPDIQSFSETALAIQIPSVSLFKRRLVQELNEGTLEDDAARRAGDEVLRSRADQVAPYRGRMFNAQDAAASKAKPVATSGCCVIL